MEASEHSERLPPREGRAVPQPGGGSFRRSRFDHSPVTLIAGALCLTYLFFFFQYIGQWWFDPTWTTDDAQQQSYPFFKLLYPEAFKGDLITRMMECYLSPLHYGITAVFVYITHDPVMAGHWVMLVQLLFAGAFMFLAVRHAAGTAAAFVAFAWLLHTRNVMQRLTGGLPRGWAAGMLTAFLYFGLRGDHRGMLVLIFIGCFLHPVVTMMIAASYGLFLLWEVADPATRARAVPKFKSFLLTSPLFLLAVLAVVRMPPEIGSMASYSEALSMPEFGPGGRFPFTPLKPAMSEILSFGFQSFVTRFYDPGELVGSFLPLVVSIMFLGLIVARRFTGREIIPRIIVAYGISIFVVYFLSRLLAFRLYVPDRHLQFPLAMFFISGFSIGVWRLLVTSPRKEFLGGVGLALLLSIVVMGSGTGLYGPANFNTSLEAKGRVFQWIKKNTPEDALIAGDPTFLDPLMLISMRKAYVTTETAHPFYNTYYKEMARRIDILLRAYYAKSLPDLVNLLAPEGIGYFVFERRDFYPEALAKARYFRPFDALVRTLVSGPPEQYAYRELPAELDVAKYPFVPYRDDFVVVVDINSLKHFLEGQSS